MSLPPHLPAPTCSVKSHNNLQRIKLILAAAFFGLAGGLSGAAVIIGWIWPGLGGGDAYLESQNYSLLARNQLSESLQVEAQQRVAQVYKDISDNSGLAYLSEQKKIGTALIITSDGWLAMYLPVYDGLYKNWRVLLSNGTVYTVKQVLRDARSNYVYLKLEIKNEAQFKVVNFAESVKAGDDVYVYSGGTWKRNIVQDKVYQPINAVHLDTASHYGFLLANPVKSGAVVLNNQGKIAGVIADSGLLIGGETVSRVLPYILSAQKVLYRTLGVEGWYSEENPILNKTEKINGFAVARVLSKNSVFHIGDVIMEISGQVANSNTMWYNISGNSSVKVKILRKGKIVEFETSVLEL